MTKAYGFKHQFFGQFFRACLDHHDRVCRAGNSQVQPGMLHLRLQRINYQLVVDIAYAYRSYRACKWNIRYTKGRRRAHNPHNIGVILLIRGKYCDYDLHIVTISLGEQRAERTIGEAASENGMFRGTPLSFDKPAGDFSRGIHTLFYING